MKLHTNEPLFEDAIAITAKQLAIPQIYIEKDYWVTAALHKIFHSPVREDAVFKGGTALAKCHGLIQRFSEDVDLAVIHREQDTNSSLKAKIKTITRVVDQLMPEIEVDGVTRKRGMNRKTVHDYPKQGFQGVYGQVKSFIILEATWLGSSEPNTIGEVSSFITNMMQASGQEQLIDQYDMAPFTVKVLSKERTLCEKIMSLFRFSQTKEPYTNLAAKVRHVYDIHLMLQHPDVSAFFESTAFEELLLAVGEQDKISFKNNNQWVVNHPASVLIFREPELTWQKIKEAYKTFFSEMVYGKLPEDADLIETLKRVKKRLDKVVWNIVL